MTLLILATMLGAARYIVPPIIEESRFAWRRGQLRAEYESSGEGLKNVSLDSLTQAYQMVAERVGPSVVHIDVERRGSSTLDRLVVGSEGLESPLLPSDQGSGVVVDAEGYVLTNYHVIQDARRTVVGLSDGRRVEAEIVGSDRLTDLAVLKVEAGLLIPVTWGDSDHSRVGAPVWALGSPFGLDRTVTHGILSGKHRAAKLGPTHRYQDFMQSDAAVNPGNSGGPLVDARGHLIGINTMIVGDTYRGVSFSIPSNVARRVYERIRATGHVERPWLGVALAAVPDAMVEGRPRESRGVLVDGLIDEDSPAGRAGLMVGDVILRFQGRPIADIGQLQRMVGASNAGDQADLEILRDGRLQTIAVELAKRPHRYDL